MRIVHKDIEILRIEDALQTARHAAERFETTERFGIEAEPEGDALLIAGKGHESTQQIGDVKHPFSDQQTVREILGCA